MDISQLCKDAHQVALDGGWYDPPKSFGEMILMCHSELSEVVEDYRKHGFDDYYENGGKPCGVQIELADLLIRVADLCENYNFDIESAIRSKMEYNKTRSRRHGNKAL